MGGTNRGLSYPEDRLPTTLLLHNAGRVASNAWIRTEDALNLNSNDLILSAIMTALLLLFIEKKTIQKRLCWTLFMFFLSNSICVLWWWLASPHI